MIVQFFENGGHDGGKTALEAVRLTASKDPVEKTQGEELWKVIVRYIVVAPWKCEKFGMRANLLKSDKDPANTLRSPWID